MTPSPLSTKTKLKWSWRSKTFRGFIYQVTGVSIVLLALYILTQNTLANMATRGIQSGFDFLSATAGFDIGESVIPYDSRETYWKAFLIGLLNTLRVAILGIILTTVLGTLIGVGKFSRNALIRGVCTVYVEFFRNIPVLIQLLIWYLLLTELLPNSWEPWKFGNFFLSKGGLNFPEPIWVTGHLIALVGLGVSVLAIILYKRQTLKKFEATGKLSSTILVPLLILIAGPFIGWVLGGTPSAMNAPHKGEFAIEGGAAVTPEFLAVLLGLSIYTAAFVAEVVRAGIQSVSTGQGEAAAALGLNKTLEMRLILLPQALRVIIPPLSNQYLNLTKNSSLAVAIGYPDLVSISNTAMNQTGRAVECIAIVMVIYLCTSLATAALMNWYNNRTAIQER